MSIIGNKKTKKQTIGKCNFFKIILKINRRLGLSDRVDVKSQ